jgi:DNA modification methylase
MITIGNVTVHHGNCLDILPTLPDCSVDSVVTDPPYELGFMGKKWDASGIAYRVDLWSEVLRVLKPGGHLLAFGGTRTYHRMAVAIEDAGFEIRDSIHYMYGSGFPKSLNVKKAAKDSTCQCGQTVQYNHDNGDMHRVRQDVSDIPSVAAKSPAPEMQSGVQWQGTGSRTNTPRSQRQSGVDGRFASLVPEKDDRSEQPSMEGWSDFPKGEGQLHRPEVRQVSSRVDRNGSVGRLHNGTSPSDGAVGWQASGEDGSGEPHQPQPSGQSARELGTIPEQRRPQAWGGWPVCGGCSKPILPEGLGSALKPAHEPIVVARRPLIGTVAANVLQHGTGALNIDGTRIGTDGGTSGGVGSGSFRMHGFTNLNDLRAAAAEGGKCPDGRDAATCLATYERNLAEAGPITVTGRWPANVIFDPDAATELDRQQDGASRFFYIAKPSKAERNAGLDGLPKRNKYQAGGVGGTGGKRDVAEAVNATPAANHHPTVKPLTLMRYLVRLVTPPGGTVLEPFAGSGTTLMAATMEGFNSIGIEMTDDYLPIIEGRVRWAQTQQQELFT